MKRQYQPTDGGMRGRYALGGARRKAAAVADIRVIEVKESSRSSSKFKRLLGEDAVQVTVPQWLDREKNALKGTVVKMPERGDIDMPIEEHLIVELYSK